MSAKGLPPCMDAGAKILVIGTFPSERSLDLQQYYANRRNRFWDLIFYTIGKTDPIIYDERLRLLSRSQIALWDALAECDRVGSGDKSIRNEVVNDICAFLQSNQTIQRLYFNGQKPQEFLEKHLGRDCTSRIDRIGKVLPSSSPANTHMSFDEKKAAWRARIVL